MLSFYSLIIVSFLFTRVLPSPLVLHEKRDELLAGPALAKRRVQRDALLPMRINLMQNEHATLNAERWLMDVSHPASDNYGRHWSREDIVKAFQPSQETIDHVTAWLHSHDILDYYHGQSKMWLSFDVPAFKAERMLNTQYFEHITEDNDSEAFCDSYYVPEHLTDHINYITPGLKRSPIASRDSHAQRQVARRKRHVLSASSGGPSNGVPSYINATELEYCWFAATPACIRALNNITEADSKLPVSKNNSLGLFEYGFQGLFYQPSLNNFFHHFAPEIPQGTSAIFKPIAGTYYPETKANYSSNQIDGLEGELDLAIALPIIYPQNATTFNVESGIPTDALNIWLDALDESYCHALQPPYTGNTTRQCGIYKPPPVIAVTYDIGEQAIKGSSVRQLQAQCNEYLKLGLQGVSIFISSGDYGVGEISLGNSTGGSCTTEAGERVFGPFFPAACPWVTAVGSTQIPEHKSVNDAQVGAIWYYYQKHKSVYTGSSGGGFSLHYPPPSYQKSTLATFFKDHPPKWPYFTNGVYHNNTGRYNRNGRGYPDLSALGTNVVEFYDTKFTTDNGTSCSAPLIGGMFNRIVEERLRAGKGPLGFVNPVLYENPHMFTDILSGGNGFCSPDQGFQAGPGWDPVTGLGVPSYPKLLEVFMNMK